MGNFDIRASDQEPQDAGRWFAVDSPVQVEAGQTVVIPFTVTAPELATPGDHPAGIAATVIRAANTEGVGIESRAGVRVNIRVPGTLEPRAGVVITSAAFDPGWNPLAPGELTVTYEATNEGNVRLEIDSLLRATGLFGIVTATSRSAGSSEILPGGMRSGQIRVKAWPTVITAAEIGIQPTAIATENVAAIDEMNAQATVVSLPVPQAVALAFALLIALTLIRRRRAQQAKLEAMIAAAREQGRHEATT